MAKHDPHRLDMLLRIRKRQEELRAQSVAEARREVRTAQDLRASLARNQHQALLDGASRSREEFDAGDVRRYYQYERHLAHLSVAKDAEIQGLQTEVEDRRILLEAALKKRRIIERLQIRRWKAWLAEAHKEEQKQSDEVANNYTARTATTPAEIQEERR
jgi:flagellar export protein FliJ